MADTDLALTIENHRGFWTGDSGPLVALSVHTPLSPLQIPLADGTLAVEDMYLTPDQLDPSFMVNMAEVPGRPRLQPDRPGAVTGDMLITRAPYSAMCWVEAVMGCRVATRVASGSIYSEPYLDGPDDLERMPSHHENGWLDFLVRHARVLAERADGRYHVPLPLMRGTIDVVAALLGYEKMCFSFADQPRELRKLIERCVETYLAMADELHAALPALEGGRVDRHGVWAPGPVNVTQCDASAAISARLYEEFFFPFDAETCSHFDYSVVHLHSGFLHTVDTLLEGEYPTAIQVSLDTGSTPLTPHDLMPTFKRVLEKKPLIISGACTRRELDEMLEALPPKGLCIGASLTDAA